MVSDRIDIDATSIIPLDRLNVEQPLKAKFGMDGLGIVTGGQGVALWDSRVPQLGSDPACTFARERGGMELADAVAVSPDGKQLCFSISELERILFQR